MRFGFWGGPEISSLIIIATFNKYLLHARDGADQNYLILSSGPF